MIKKILFFFSFGLILTVSPLVSYPLGQDIIGPVQAAGSDQQAVNFNTWGSTDLNAYWKIANQDFFFSPPATTSVPSTTLLADPSNISIATDSSVRLYYVSSYAQFNNTIGFSLDQTLSPGEKSIVFPNASNRPSSASSDPNSPYPRLNVGDFVDLGILPAGSNLNLYIGADAADNTLQGLYWNDRAQNSDGIAHAKTVQFNGTNYYFIGWEDLARSVSDLDFNDVFIVAEIVPIPEPSTYILIACFLGACYIIKARKTAVKTSA